VQEVWASSEFAKQTAGLIEPLLDHMLSEVSGLKKDDVFDCIPQENVLKSDSHSNGLFAAIQTAYSGHHHLHLRPDDLWLTICQGVSKHLRFQDNAEKYRSVFVDHQGKQEISISADGQMTGEPQVCL
jgi:hypothetical protein